MADINSLVRVGYVSDINPSDCTARVVFPDMSDIVSDWLYVMRYPNLSLTVNSAGAHDHGGAVASGGGHSHTIGIVDWFPNVNDKVLVLMAPGFNSDGYILGVIQ